MWRVDRAEDAKCDEKNTVRNEGNDAKELHEDRDMSLAFKGMLKKVNSDHCVPVRRTRDKKKMKNEGSGGGWGKWGQRERGKVPNFLVTPCFIVQFVRALQLIIKLLLREKKIVGSWVAATKG